MIDIDRNATRVPIVCGFVFGVLVLLCTKAQEEE